MDRDGDRVDLRGQRGGRLDVPRQELVVGVERVHLDGRRHDPGQRADVEVQSRHRGEEARAGAAGRPEEIGMLLIGRVKLLAVGGDHVDRAEAERRRSDDARVEPEPATEGEAGHAHGRAMSAGEVEAVRGQSRGELVAAHARFDHRDPGLGIDLDAFQLGQIEQEPAVAYRVTAPGMAAGTDADREVLFAGQRDRARHVPAIPGHDDHRGHSVGFPGVPDGRAPRLLVTVVAVPVHRTREALHAQNYSAC